MPRLVYVVEREGRLKSFLQERLVGLDVEVSAFANLNVLQAYVKNRFDLLILTLTEDSRKIIDFLQEHGPKLTVRNVSVFLIGDRFSQQDLESYRSLGVKQVYERPLRIEHFLRSLATALSLSLEVDTTPCAVEAHLNDEVLYIDIGLGFNREKFAFLTYRVPELLSLYEVKLPKVILSMPDYALGKSSYDVKKLTPLLGWLLDLLGGRSGWMAIVCAATGLRDFLAEDPRLAQIAVVPNMEAALDTLMLGTGRDLFDEKHLREQSRAPSSVELGLGGTTQGEKRYKAAVVDDDFIVHEIVKNTLEGLPIQVVAFEEGKSFLDSLNDGFDLIFLDLMMPGLTGFDVLGRLKQAGVTTPVIITSALSRRETVLKAMSFGIKSYLIKPLKPADILRKVKEVLESAL